MKKFRRVILVVLVLALAGIVSSVKWREPRYHWRPISSWLAKYGDGPGNYKPSPEADYALRQMGSNAVPYLLKLLHSTNSYSHYTFVWKPAMRFTSGASGGWNRLSVWWMNTRYRFQRVTVPATWDHWKAYLAFQALGPEAKSAIPDLIKVANDPCTNSFASGNAAVSFLKDREIVARYATWASNYSPDGIPLFPAKILMLSSLPGKGPFLSDGEIAAWSLAAIGADSVPPLMKMLTNSAPQLRYRAAVALGMIGKSAEPAVLTLVKMLDDPDAKTRHEAAEALGCIGEQPDLVVPALLKFLGDKDMVVYTFEPYGAFDMGFYAIESLGAFGERATNAIPALLAILFQADKSLDQSSGQSTIRYVALALNKISPEVTRKEVIPLLIHRTQDPKSPWNQSMTLDTLGQMTNQPDLVMPVLVEALDTTIGYPRINIIYQLSGFGPAAKAAVPKLVSFSTSRDTNLCRIATNALDRIEPGWRTGH
jgi:HEAT repeat protein